MKDHEIILKMIEEVSPDDTAKLDEIDVQPFGLIAFKASRERVYFGA